MNNLSGKQTNTFAFRIALLFVLMVAVLRINDCNASDNVTALASTPLDLTYDRKLISGRIQNVALGVVLDTLVRNVGLRVRFIDPAIALQPVSTLLHRSRLEGAVTEILYGFSYALSSDARETAVVVLSTPPSSRAHNLTRSINVADSPSTLEEFEKIDIAEVTYDDYANGAADGGLQQNAKENEYNEARLERALKALESDQKQIHGEALEEIVGLKDPRASRALAEAVVRAADADAQNRYEVVAALVRHVEGTQEFDANVVDVLQQLASDSDSNIRGIASQALSAMNR